MIFRVHADTEQGERINRDIQAGSALEATKVCGKQWKEEGVKIAKVVKTKVVKGVAA